MRKSEGRGVLKIIKREGGGTEGNDGKGEKFNGKFYGKNKKGRRCDGRGRE